MKRIVSLALALCMVLSLFTVGVHAETNNNEALQAAEELHRLGLFQGVGTNTDGTINYDLNRAMSREEGVTMLVRLLGMEDEAKKGTWKAPFTDVSEWAKPYVNYAYTNELTNGIGSNQYGGGTGYTMTATQYLTFCLRSMGYTSGKDFQWDSAWTLTDKLGITNKQYNAGNNTKFTRGDAAIVSLATYRATMLKIYGLPVDMLKVSPETRYGNPESYVLNFMYNMAIGHYDEWIPGPAQGFAEDSIFFTKIYTDELSEIYPEMFGGLAWMHGDGDRLCIAQVDGTYNYFLEHGSLKKIWEQNNEAIKVARKIKSELHSSGKITDGMTQKEIEYEYFKYMREKYVPEIEYVFEDNTPGSTAYGCLVEKKCNSVGRAAAFNLLMRLEGIRSISVPMVDNSHANLMLLGGEFWISDFGDKGGSLWSSDYDKLVNYRFVRGLSRDVAKRFNDLAMATDHYYGFKEHLWKHNHMFMSFWDFNGDSQSGATYVKDLADNDHFTWKTVEGNLKMEYLGNCIVKITPTDGSKITVTDPKKFRTGSIKNPDANPLDESFSIQDGSLYWIIPGLKESSFKTSMKDHFDFSITNGITTWTVVTKGIE